jgi:hypothetical protein
MEIPTRRCCCSGLANISTDPRASKHRPRGAPVSRELLRVGDLPHRHQRQLHWLYPRSPLETHLRAPLTQPNTPPVKSDRRPPYSRSRMSFQPRARIHCSCSAASSEEPCSASGTRLVSTGTSEVAVLPDFNRASASFKPWSAADLALSICPLAMLSA